MLKQAAVTILLLLFVFNVSASSIQLEEGWNTFAVDSAVDESDLISSSTCSFHSVQGTTNYFFEQGNQGEYSPVGSLNPWKAYYGWVSTDCVLELEEGEWEGEVELDPEEWNLIRSPDNLEVLDNECEISSGSLDYKYYTELGGDIVGLNDDDSLMNQNRGIFVWPTKSCTLQYEGLDEEASDQPVVEEDYLEFSEASVISSEVSPDESDLVVEYSFDRDSAVSNNVEADLGLHIDEGSSPTEVYTVEDSSDTQELSLEWSILWDKFGSVQEDVSVQLVLEERLEGDYRWNEDSIDAGDFDIERCSNFESNIDADEWEYDYSPEEISSCLSEVSMDSTSNEDEYDFRIHSEDNGVCGEVELDSTYWDGNGAEVVEIDLDTLEHSSNFRETELMIRHFEGGPQSDSDWITLLQEDLSDIHEASYVVEFVETDDDDLHNYNKVEITLGNDYCGGDELDVSGTISYQEYSEDGPGTCKPGETWCGQQHGEGDCIDEDNYSPGLCY